MTRLRDKLHSPGFGTQGFHFIFLDELTASELLYLSVQVTDVPHCHTHRELLTLFTFYTPGSLTTWLLHPNSNRTNIQYGTRPGICFSQSSMCKSLGRNKTMQLKGKFQNNQSHVCFVVYAQSKVLLKNVRRS